MTLFVILAGIGLVLLLLSLLLDGIFDFDLGDGLLSFTTLAVFIAVFGFGGIIAQTTLKGSLGQGAATGVAVAIGVGLGLVAALLAGLISRSLRRSTTGESSSEQLLGRIGTVITPAEPGAHGEITAEMSGAPTKLSAVSDVPLFRGEQVEIIAILSATSVRVAPRKETW